MKKVNIITSILSGLGFVFSTIALIMLLIRGEPFLPELVLDALVVHPLTAMIFSGLIFFPTITQLFAEKKK